MNQIKEKNINTTNYRSSRYIGIDHNNYITYKCNENNNSNLKYKYYLAFKQDNLIIFKKENQITKENFDKYNKKFYCEKQISNLICFRYPKEQRESFVRFEMSANYAFREIPRIESKKKRI